MNKYYPFCYILSSALVACSQQKTNLQANKKPNIILIMADDLGYGDLSCYGAKTIQTPNIDSLAINGLRFTDGHCTSATSSPSRFSMLTGSYAFRNQVNILPGDAPLLIKPGTETIATMLNRAGYTSAVVGKWHLGLGNGKIDWNDSIKPGPHEIGFDYSFLIPATGDRVPCVFVEDYNVANLDKNDPIVVSYSEKLNGYPNGIDNQDMLSVNADEQHSQTIVNGVSRIGFMKGGKSALWKDEEFCTVLTYKAIQFMNKNRKQPFFLYFAFHDIHVPRVVNAMFEGKSSMGARGDAILQMDWFVGELMKNLRALGLEENTIVVFTSDNGPVLNDGYDDSSEKLVGNHNITGGLRGGKYSAFEGATRVPFIVYWKSVIQSGVSQALVSQVDFLATFAKITSTQLTQNSAPDSYDLTEAFLGKTNVGRKFLIEESGTLSLRMNHWKYIQKSKYKYPYNDIKKIDMGVDTVPQLYNLSNDISEQKNVALEFTDTLAIMKNTLEKYIKIGHSQNH